MRRSGFKRKFIATQVGDGPVKVTRYKGLGRSIRPAKVRKGKKVTVTSLKKKLWKVFSDYIRTRDNWTCFTCNRKGTGSGMHSGHFIPKSVSGFSLYFHEEAVHAQCYFCNVHRSGNWLAYEEAMIKKYGKERTEEIKAMARTVTKSYTPEEYLFKIRLYENKLKQLQAPADAFPGLRTS